MRWISLLNRSSSSSYMAGSAEPGKAWGAVRRRREAPLRGPARRRAQLLGVLRGLLGLNLPQLNRGFREPCWQVLEEQVPGAVFVLKADADPGPETLLFVTSGSLYGPADRHH